MYGSFYFISFVFAQWVRKCYAIFKFESTIDRVFVVCPWMRKSQVNNSDGLNAYFYFVNLLRTTLHPHFKLSTVLKKISWCFDVLVFSNQALMKIVINLEMPSNYILNIRYWFYWWSHSLSSFVLNVLYLLPSTFTCWIPVIFNFSESFILFIRKRNFSESGSFDTRLNLIFSRCTPVYRQSEFSTTTLFCFVTDFFFTIWILNLSSLECFWWVVDVFGVQM